MKSNTDLSIKSLPTEEVERQFGNVENSLLYESFGSDYEAYWNEREERSKLLQELRRRGVAGY